MVFHGLSGTTWFARHFTLAPSYFSSLLFSHARFLFLIKSTRVLEKKSQTHVALLIIATTFDLPRRLFYFITSKMLHSPSTRMVFYGSVLLIFAARFVPLILFVN